MAGAQPQRWASGVPEGGDELRERLVAAIAKAAAEHGYDEFTVDQVLLNARVSRQTFDQHFESREQGLIAAQEAFLDRLWREVAGACEAAGEWPQKVRAALAAVIASLVEASTMARVFAVEASASSLAAAERQLSALERFAAMLRDGRRHYPDASSLPEATERALIGGIASILSGHLLAEDPGALPALQPQLVELLLIPYLGVGEARRVARA